MATDDPGDDLTLALSLADTADELTRARWHAADLRVDRKPDHSPVTDADLAVEDAVRAALARARPGDAVAGEERGASGPAHRVWLLDPIDGTMNFSRGVPVWATLLALVRAGRPVLGVVSAPALHRRWWAAEGAGAYVSEPGGTRRITVSRVTDLADACLSTTALGSWAEHHDRAAYLALVDAVCQTRAFGDFWQHCLVAEGAIDLAAEPVVNPWDVAAVQVLVEQAGGRFTDLAGRAGHDGGTALSSNGLLHDRALGLLSGLEAGTRVPDPAHGSANIRP